MYTAGFYRSFQLMQGSTALIFKYTAGFYRSTQFTIMGSTEFILCKYTAGFYRSLVKLPTFFSILLGSTAVLHATNNFSVHCWVLPQYSNYHQFKFNESFQYTAGFYRSIRASIHFQYTAGFYRSIQSYHRFRFHKNFKYTAWFLPQYQVKCWVLPH